MAQKNSKAARQSAARSSAVRSSAAARQGRADGGSGESHRRWGWEWKDRRWQLFDGSLGGVEKMVVAGAILLALVWSYWPTWRTLVETWGAQADYSHGFLVIPLAAYFLWARRDSLPRDAGGPAWAGLSLVALSLFVRWQGARFYLEAADGWSLVLLVGGVAWFLGGWRFFRWTAPATLFLFFMIPLPFTVEHMISGPLQTIAARGSCILLQCLGQPAIREGTTLLVGDNHLEVERACAGLRMFMGIIALGYAYVVLTKRPLWEKGMLMLAVAPIALIANGVRIAATGLLYQYVSGEAARTFSHDGAGWAMIVLSAAMFGLLLWYLRHLLMEVEILDRGELVRDLRN